MPEASKEPEEAIREHKQNFQSRKDLIKEIESCIKSGEISIDEKALIKVDEKIEEEEVEEMQQPEEVQHEEEKPANPSNVAPFNLEEFEERITKKVQL